MHVYTLCYNNGDAYIHWVTCAIYIVVHFTHVLFLLHNVYHDVPQCISYLDSCVGLYIVLHGVYTLEYIAPYIHCITLDIYIVLHRVYTLCCIEPNIHCVVCVIYIVLHRLYTLHCIARCYTMYILLHENVYSTCKTPPGCT